MAVDPAVLETLRESGPPIIATSVMVALGFSVLLLAGLAPTARFGALSAGIALLALAAVLWLLPGLLRLAPRRLLGRMPVARQE
jgi:hypothetical protein